MIKNTDLTACEDLKDAITEEVSIIGRESDRKGVAKSKEAAREKVIGVAVNSRGVGNVEDHVLVP